MNNAFVKLMGNTGLFKLTKDNAQQVKIHPQDKMCLLVPAGEMVNLKDDTVIEDSIIHANQTILVKPKVPLNPTHYHAIVSYSPELAKLGVLASPVSLVVRPGEEDEIGLVLRPSKKTDLSEIAYIFQIYMID